MSDNSPHTLLPFPPISTQHILNCSYHSWHPRYRTKTPKARLVPLSQPFIEYLRADGIILPPDSLRHNSTADDDSGYSDASDEDEDADPSDSWPEIHSKIRETIEELGGKVLPKLNWSAPKDATWMSSTNDMECRTANEIYLLLKSSDFITHDLEQAFDGCADITPSTPVPPIPYHLVLRKAFNLNPSLEFRVFVRKRRIIAVSQREMNYFEFLFDLRKSFQARIFDFFEKTLQSDFPDEDFVFDVYIPPPHERVWLIDINPWAPRTDPLLFSWLELLTMDIPGEEEQNLGGGSEDEEVEEVIFSPEFRLVQRDDPEAYQFAATKYSAHKLPKDVVDASTNPGGMKDMMEEWKKVMERQNADDSDESKQADEDEGESGAAEATREARS